MGDHYSSARLNSDDGYLADQVIDIFHWDFKDSGDLKLTCHIMTKEGQRITINEKETITSNKAPTKVNTEPSTTPQLTSSKTNNEVPANITSELAEIKETLRVALEELSASKKRKRGEKPASE